MLCNRSFCLVIYKMRKLFNNITLSSNFLNFLCYEQKVASYMAVDDGQQIGN